MNRSKNTLADLSTGQSAIVIALHGGREFQQRIAGLGIYIGCEIKALGNQAKNGVLIAVGESRIAIGHGMAKKVFIT